MPFSAPTKGELDSFNEEYKGLNSDTISTDTPSNDKLDRAMSALYDTESGDKQLTPSGTPVMSPVGAIGAAQIMPSTGPEAAKLAGMDWDENRFNNDKDYNKALGKAYFKNQLDKFGGDYEKAFAAYNAGAGNVKKALAKAEAQGTDWKEHLPEETKDYIAKNTTKMGLERNPASSKNSKFTPPTKEELDEFEKSSNPNKDSIFGNDQELGDAVKSLGQGLTLGGGDELVGAIQGTKDYFTDPKVTNWLDAYRNRQKAAEDEYSKVKERSPALSLGGELAGGLIPAVLTGGATAEMSVLPRIAAMGGLGATAGGLSSKGTLGSNEQLKDSATGLLLGAGTEGLISAAKPAISAAKNMASGYVEDSPKFRQLLKSFNLGKEGQGFGGNANRELMQQELEKNASSLGSDLDKMNDYGQEQYSKVLGKNPETGELLPNAPTVQVKNSKDLESISDAVSSLENAKGIAGPRNQDAIATLSKLKGGEKISAQEAKELQKYLRDNAFKLNQGTTSDELTSASKTASKLLTDQVPGYSEINELHGAIKDPINSFIKNVPADELSIASRPKGATIDTNTFKSAEDVIRKSELPYGMGDKQSNQLRLLKQGLKNLQAKDPAALEKMGISNIDDYFKKIQSQADTQSINKLIESGGQLNKDTFNLLGSGYGAALKTANVAGGITGGMGKVLYKMPAEQLSKVSATLLQSPTTKHLGIALQQAIENPNEAAKNAALFTIMQNPNARQAISGMIPGVQQSDEK